MLRGEGAGAGVLGKELSGGELREGVWHLGPAGRGVTRGNLGEEAVGSGKLSQRCSVNKSLTDEDELKN